MTTLPIAIIVSLLLTTTTALIGYDCGGRVINVTTVFLLDVGDCDIFIFILFIYKAHCLGLTKALTFDSLESTKLSLINEKRDKVK